MDEKDFAQRWRQTLWSYERTSLFSLSPTPVILNEQTITDYLRYNKSKQRLGSSFFLWLLLVWIPMGVIVCAGCVLWYMFCWWLLLHAKPFLVGILWCWLLLIPSKNTSYWKNIQIFWSVLYFLGGGLSLFLLFPLFPWIWVRKQQLSQSYSWSESFRIAFWRKTDPRLVCLNPYISSFDRWAFAHHRRFVLLFVPKSPLKESTDVQSFIYGHFNDYLVVYACVGARLFQLLFFVFTIVVIAQYA